MEQRPTRAPSTYGSHPIRRSRRICPSRSSSCSSMESRSSIPSAVCRRWDRCRRRWSRGAMATVASRRPRTTSRCACGSPITRRLYPYGHASICRAPPSHTMRTPPRVHPHPGARAARASRWLQWRQLRSRAAGGGQKQRRRPLTESASFLSVEDMGIEPTASRVRFDTHGTDGPNSSGISRVPIDRYAPVLTPSDDPLTAAFDALAAQLRRAIARNDRAAIGRLRAALDALLAPVT